MSGTLERLGSIRRSLRHPKKLLAAPDVKHGKDACTSSSMPEKVEEVGLKEGSSSKQTYFRLSVADASISVNNNYRPSFLRLVVCRRKTKYRSELISWEPSFKCTSTGSVVWPHPFQCTIAITPPSIKDSATGTLRHKDITISLQNVEKHSKHSSSKSAKKNKKTLAKVRLNLADYYEANDVIEDVKHNTTATSTYKASSLKIKLRPESSKVANASINLTIQRTNYNPSALLPIHREIPEKNSDHKDDEIPATASQVITSNVNEPDRYSSSDASSVDTISQKSQLDSPIKTPVKLVLPSEGEKQHQNNSPIHSSVSTTTGSFNQSNIQPSNKNGCPIEKTSPNIPPPLPLRDWQKNNSKISNNSEILTTELAYEQKRLLPESTAVKQVDEPVNAHERSQSTIQPDLDYTPLENSSDKTNQLVAVSVSQDTAKGHISTEEETLSILQIGEDHIKDVLQDKIILHKELDKLELPHGYSNTALIDSSEKVKKEVIEDSPVKPSIFATPEKSLHRIKVPPSPQMRPNKPNEKEKQLIEWANKTLSNQEPPIKITNLFTSWQNGLGFCALIRKYFSKIIPPINQLKTDQRSQNCQLAVEAAELLGIETSLITCKENKDGMVLDKTTVKIFLQELKTTFQNIEAIQLSEDTVIEFQCQWYRKAGYFADVAENIIYEEELKNKKAEEEIKIKEQAEKDRIVQEQQDKEREEIRKKLYENGEQFDLSKNDRRTDEVHILIKEAHNSADRELDPSEKSNNPDLPDADNATNNLKKLFPDEEQHSPDSEPSSASTTQEYQSCKEDDRSTTVEILDMQNNKIVEELHQLGEQELILSQEKQELSEKLHEEEQNSSELEVSLYKYQGLVNQQNSVLRKQMQLNIQNKDNILAQKLHETRKKLRYLNDMEDEKKTEADKQAEECLLKLLIDLINKKSDLVLELDVQESFIEEDNSIEKILGSRSNFQVKRKNKTPESRWKQSVRKWLTM